MLGPEGHRAKLLTDAAAAIGAIVARRRGTTLDVRIEIPRPGGSRVAYELEIDCRPCEPTAKELKPRQLPTFCPNRHINWGGGFCASYSDADPLPVTDADSAAAWWRQLWKYLSLQVTAERLRRWPDGREWAHGHAAQHQRRAEGAAAALGHRFEEALTIRRLEVRPQPGRAAFAALYDGNTRLYSVWMAEKRVATLRQACICGSRLQLRRCGCHAADAVTLLLALIAWKREEAAFWRGFEGKPCCGTLDDCPLRAGSATSGLAASDPTINRAAA